MTDDQRKKKMHDIDVTVWVGKNGVDAVVDELRDQLAEREMVKVKFLRASRGGTTTEELAETLAEKADAELFETRGHTGVYIK